MINLVLAKNRNAQRVGTSQRRERRKTGAARGRSGRAHFSPQNREKWGSAHVLIAAMPTAPPTPFEAVKRALFGVLSRSCVAVYARLPIFGPLRASVAVIRDGEMVLVIERSDGRGLSFPGGLTWPWESPEQAMVREVEEETGLRIKTASLFCEYEVAAETSDIPCVLSVYHAETTGELVDSWEGSPRWHRLGEIRARLLPSQRRIVDRLG
jgi:8-oxo-dGTP pyrophosphatase MutT (NUDIX family)